MSQFHLFPEGLKDRDYERGRPRGPPPLAFLPAKEGKNEAAIEKKMVKIKINDTLTESVNEFNSGTPEAYIRLIDTYEGLKRRMGLQDSWDARLNIQKGHDSDLQLHELSKPTPEEENEPAVVPPPPPARAPEETGAAVNSTAAGSATAGDSTTPVETRLQVWEAKRQHYANIVKFDDDMLASYLRQAFETFERLLSEPARDRWASITLKVTTQKNWTDDKGDAHAEARGQTWLSLRLCQREFLLEVFQKDAAEKQRDYLLYQLKKPGRQSLRNWVARLRYLSRAIKYLPCLADSDDTPPDIERTNRELTEYELCSVIMRAIKQKWIDQYRLGGHPLVPIDSARFVSTLEDVEQADNNEKRRAELLSDGRIPKKQKKGGDGKAGRDRPFKGKSDRSGDRTGGGDRNSEKGCALCKKHGGAWKTHRTSECKRYNSDGSKKQSFKGGPAWKRERESFKTQMMSMREEMGKLHAAMKGSRKRKRGADTDDSSDDE